MSEKKIEAKLVEVNKVKFPLVTAAFKGKDGNVYTGVMLVDTGSGNCILSKSVVSLLGADSIRKDDQKSILSMQSAANTCYGVDFTFKMGGGMFNEVFYVNDDFDFDQVFGSFIGIIGHSFLRKHKLTLDYSTESLHSSDGELGDPADYEFFFPMSFGIQYYDVPVIGLVNNNKEYVFVADSGANNTVTTQHVVSEAGIAKDTNACKGSVLGFNYTPMDTTIQGVNLYLLSIGGTEEDPKICEYTDEVQVITEHKHIMDGLKDDEGYPIPPISGLLSSEFMFNHKWVLDFGLGVMYCKAA